MRLIRISTCLALLLPASFAGAQPRAQVQIERAVYVERVERERGREIRELVPADRLRPGDTVVLMLAWTAPARTDGFTLSSPIPRQLAFQRAGSREPQVSVDNGRSWARLDQLRIGARRASPEEVTDLRWRVSQGQAARGRGMVSFSAIVR